MELNFVLQLRHVLLGDLFEGVEVVDVVVVGSDLQLAKTHLLLHQIVEEQVDRPYFTFKVQVNRVQLLNVLVLRRSKRPHVVVLLNEYGLGL